MSAILDLTDLFVSSSEYTDRADFAHVFDRFLKMAEDRMSKALRLDGTQSEATIIADAQGRAALPADFREVRSVKLATGRVLTGGSLDILDATFRDAGTPCAFAIGGGFIHLRPRQAATIVLTYFAGMPRLTAAAPSNAILLRYPDCYLYGVIYEVMVWSAAKGEPGAADRATALLPMLEDAISSATIDNERRMYSQSRLRLAGRAP